MDRILTDPDLMPSYQSESVTSLRTKLNFLEKENANYRDSISDLKTQIKINKDMIKAIVVDLSDEMVSKQALEKAINESAHLETVVERVKVEKEEIQMQLLLTEQIQKEQTIKAIEETEGYEAQLDDYKEHLERKEYSLQQSEQRIKDYESLLAEIANYDDYIRQKFEEMRLNIGSMERNQKITNVVDENKALKEKVSKLEVDLDQAN